VTDCGVAQAVASAIATAGVELAFAFPGGGSNLALIDELGCAGIRLVLTRSEEGGAFMAATYGELTGRPGVLLTGLGPGAASAVNGAAHALLDRAPLLVISDRYSAAEAATSLHQLLDHGRIFEPVTKWRGELTAADAYGMTERALSEAATAPRGAVHLDMARDVARQQTRIQEPDDVAVAAAPPDRDALRVAAGLLGAARRPVILVGLEGRIDICQGDLVHVAERLRAPVLATYKGKGVFPETHPLSAGILTGAEIERPLLEQADVLLAVGLDPIELLPRPWSYPARLVALREDPAPDPFLAPSAVITGPVGALVRGLAAELGASESEWTENGVAALASAVRDRLRVPSEGGLASWEVIETVAAEVPAGATVTVDAGAHMFAATSFWRATSAARFLISNGLATMGYAVPAAVAAALVRPGEPVVAFTGDGGFLLHANELETAARIGAKIIVVVLNDASLSLIRIKQEDLGLERAGVDFIRSDLALLGESLGVRGSRARTVGELGMAIRDAIAAPGSSVVDVATSGAEYAELARRIRG
jgi:acetolactate synthase-1/2/3 large subunit